MSLIEQATKRLEELKRSGIAVDDALTSRGAAGAPAFAPVPDGAPQDLFKRPGPDAAAPQQPTPEPEARARTAAPGIAKRPDTPMVEIDLEFLARNGVLTPDRPRSQLAEEFRIVKRPLIKNAQQGAARHGNLIMVTSALPGEGKSFTAVNLAMSMAMEVNNTVLLVDADVARPSVPSVLGIEPGGPGLLDVLVDQSLDVRDVLLRTNLERLSVIRAGSSQARASELLASGAMAQLADEISRRYADRIVIFDSPPLLPTTEARALAAHMGQVIVVVEAEQTTHSSVKQALAAVEQCPIVLLMLNKSGESAMGQHYGGYGSYGVPEGNEE